jgi:S-adenosylmethionine:tRNA ribosyltransferase-isomerase
LHTSDFDYHLPVERIAQHPVEPRDSAQLMIVDRGTGKIAHSIFNRIGESLRPGDLLVLNKTRVLPARVYAVKIPTGGKIELLLVRRLSADSWEALVGGKGLREGSRIQIAAEIEGVIHQVLPGSRRVIKFNQPVEKWLERVGVAPLPPYIHATDNDPMRYQTVYAQIPGSVAAPTAGLHFTQELIERLLEQGICFTMVTLHIGLDTFAPVTEDDPHEHVIHTEWCQVGLEAVEAIRRTRASGGRVIAVGTTSVRTLESAASKSDERGELVNYSGFTDLRILPGFYFKIVDGMITNFHLPRSTLIMLVSAFASREKILAAYQVAIEQNYRFYSFGDAMLIL